MPSPYLIVAIQFTLGLIIFATAFRQYVLGRLQSADVFLALGAVLPIQGFRFLGLTMLAPGQVAAGQDMGAIEIIAYGDLAAAVTGVINALAAYRRSPLTVPLAWVFTVVGLTDLTSVGVTVAKAGARTGNRRHVDHLRAHRPAARALPRLLQRAGSGWCR